MLPRLPCLVALSAVLAAVATSQLIIYEAGTSFRVGPTLKDGQVFCPFDFSLHGFSIMCVANETATTAKFYVGDELVRRERMKPFFIAGDKLDTVFPWHDWLDYDALYDGQLVITCKQDDGTVTVAKLVTSCGDPVPSSDNDLDLTEDEHDAAPGDTASETMDGAMLDATEGAPTAPPTTSPATATVASDVGLEAPAVFTSSAGCVVIDARSTLVSGDWSDTGHGVVFRDGDDHGGVAQPGRHVLEYTFKAPVSSRYAFVVDMTTAHRSEHNDVYARMPGVGFQFMRRGVALEETRSQYTKVYHNANGRSLISNSIDHNAHSISTAISLTEGVDYEIYLAGRSSKVEVHRIILFPCEADGCHRIDRTWKSSLSSCQALSGRQAPPSN